jgi:hypothetical protein
MDATKSVIATFQTGGPPSPPGDLNHDGRPDLVWYNRTSGSLYTWFLKDGKVTSGSRLDPDHVLTRTWQLRGLADLDRDTNSDLLWQDQRTGTLAAWLMNGTKMVRVVSIPDIGLPTPSSLPPAPRRRAIWQVRGLADLNGDGHNDVVWQHPQTGELYVWFMNGTTPTSGAPLNPGRFADVDWQLRGLADFNGDGSVDLLWQHRRTGELYVWFMNGTTAVSGASTSPARLANARAQVVRVTDLNEDGKPDILFQDQTTGDLRVWYMNGLTAESAGDLNPIRPSTSEWTVAPR